MTRINRQHNDQKKPHQEKTDPVLMIQTPYQKLAEPVSKINRHRIDDQTLKCPL